VEISFWGRFGSGIHFFVTFLTNKMDAILIVVFKDKSGARRFFSKPDQPKYGPPQAAIPGAVFRSFGIQGPAGLASVAILAGYGKSHTKPCFVWA
jgi:hypothetical protein